MLLHAADLKTTTFMLYIYALLLLAFGSQKSYASFLSPAITHKFGRTMKLLESDQKVDYGSGTFDNLKGVIFDIDGTLCDSFRLGFEASNSVLSRNDIEQISEEHYHECTKYSTPERLARHAGLTPSDPQFEAVGQKLATEFDNLYIGLVTTETAGFFPGVHDFIDSLHEDLAVGALTNACARYAYTALEVNLPEKKEKIFLSVRGADDVPAPKPSPDGLRLVCKELGVSPEECVYVGDSPSDAMAAKNAGMPAIAVLWGSHSEESLRSAPFDHFCNTVEELRLLLPTKSNIKT